jgi:hypothetical protein
MTVAIILRAAPSLTLFQFDESVTSTGAQTNQQVTEAPSFGCSGVLPQNSACPDIVHKPYVKS